MFAKMLLKKFQIEIDSTIESTLGIAAFVLVELWIFTAIIFSIFGAFISVNVIICTKIAFIIVAIIFGGFVAFDRGGVKSKKF